MIKFAILLVLAIDLANSQLNYEGNPFTEFTEYIAEESNLSEKSARQNDASIDLSNPGMSRPQKLYPIVESENHGRSQQAEIDNLIKSQTSSSVQTFQSDTSARQLQDSSGNLPVSQAEVALNSFLNSRTPEESRLSLEHYLRSQQSPEDQSRSSEAIVGQESQSIEPLNPQAISHVQQQQPFSHVQQQQRISHVQQQQPISHVQQQQPISHVRQQQQQPLLVPQVNQQQVQLTSQLDQVQLAPQQLMPQTDQRQLLPPASQTYGYVGQPTMVQAVQPVIRTPTGVVLGQKMLQPVPLVPAFQARNDMLTPAMWRERMRRIRGKPFPFAQSRITPTLYQGPIAVPFKAKAPVEVIYTKPPGFHRGPPILSNPPIPYEDASAWFPESDHQPSQKDVYYSQLYAQSYDPHYYNYIATTGKIRPYLYGKLGKHQEEQESGIWSELYRGFKKHGLRNIMTPTFLLGMTLPVVTLMLSALVQKRSLARSSDARELNQEEALQEYLERLQRAMECYGRNSRDTKLDGC
ncbi:histone-lysine N-methyltransferase 2D isoform X2 [Solenopsis invicta]|nr:histone-lysine N-methyltransferase 2D isoform X2 [Solenopsis invicta]XP_039307823.1 histone-lysine N-methyltransferase 2D isoform X2 [Solenopsis invicta]XP_039307824.1 histone-lysine N-methyltransferase 2D isoform X2 [Solenopsis invicta]